MEQSLQGSQWRSLETSHQDNSQQNRKNPEELRSNEANPYRSLGDALKKWKEKLEVVENVS